MTVKQKSTRRSLESARVLKRVMAEYYQELDHAARTGSKKIAWCTSVGPAELLRAMGFLVYFPENHGAMLGATRTANEYIPLANATGYSPEICSYLTSDIGAFLRQETPLTKAYEIESVPRPDVLVFNTNQCQDVQNWFRFYAERFGVPLLGIYTQQGLGELKDIHIDAIARQMEDMIPSLEQISGRTFDIEKLKETVGLSIEASRLWKGVLETAFTIPSPMTFFDGSIHMGPAVVLRGTPQAVEYYRVFLCELRTRIDQGIGAVEGETFRLYWEGMPIWGKLRALSELFASLKACVVASTYCNSWIFDRLDPEDPIRSMALAYTEIFIVRNESFKESYIEEIVDQYKIHAIVFHDARTCPNNSNNRYGMPERLQQKLNIPCLTIDGDLNDLRCFSEEQTRTNVEAFIELLEGY